MNAKKKKKALEDLVCCVLVTFNRSDLLLKTLHSLFQQSQKPDAILIVDNASSDGTYEKLLERCYLKSEQLKSTNSIVISKNKKHDIDIFYHRLPENTGGAGGFHYGVKTAYQLSYTWLWLMDDDIEFVPEALDRLLQFKDKSSCLHARKKSVQAHLNLGGFLTLVGLLAIGIRINLLR